MNFPLYLKQTIFLTEEDANDSEFDPQYMHLDMKKLRYGNKVL